VTLKVYNVLGDVVATLVQEVVHAGVHEVQWNAESVPSGVYLFRVQSGTTTITRRMILLK
jgi:flagellar hook assembly protein FlgD